MDQSLKRTKAASATESQLSSKKCPECGGHGFIFETKNGYETARKCKCRLVEETRNKLNNSGMGELINSKKFKNYETPESWQAKIKDQVIAYTREFIAGNRKSIAIMGQSGIGKTHLLAATANQLLHKGVAVKYFIADEIIQTLEACKFDEENYQREFSEIANSEVLFIDDLFKTSEQNYYNQASLNQNHLREIFKIINYRYNKNKPVMISSELTMEKLSELDQALAGRIKEMSTKQNVISIPKDKNKNYRRTF